MLASNLNIYPTDGRRRPARSWKLEAVSAATDTALGIMIDSELALSKCLLLVRRPTGILMMSSMPILLAEICASDMEDLV